MDVVSMDHDVDAVTAKILSQWDWRADGAFGTGQDASSPESSFDSMCSSPETPASGGSPTFPYALSAYGQSAAGACASPRPPKPKMSTKRRIKASEREKLRMRSLAEALHHLRDYLPPDYSRRGQPLTKIQTLKCTIEYIRELSDILNGAQF